MKFHKSNSLLLFFACLSCNLLRGQKTDSTRITIAEIKIIHSTILNEDRKIYVYNPAVNPTNYLPQQLPVLYLLDGDADISLVAGIADYLSQSSELPPMIIVGIGNFEYDRIRDLSTTHTLFNMDGATDSTRWQSSGGGDIFLKFIKDELMPYVEKNYKTSTNKIFFGHSLGGLLSIHCLLTHPEMFGAYIAVSPSLWWDKESIFKNTDPGFKNKALNNKALFFSDGNEGTLFNKSVVRLQSILQQKKITGLRYKYIPYPNETHSSELVKATQDGLRFVFETWKPGKTDTTADLVIKFYQNRSAQNGFTELPPENLINEMGYTFLSNPSKSNEAIKLFELNVKNYPASFNVFDSLGDAYASKGDKAKAIIAYKKAIELNPGAGETKKKLKALE